MTLPGDPFLPPGASARSLALAGGDLATCPACGRVVGAEALGRDEDGICPRCVGRREADDDG